MAINYIPSIHIDTLERGELNYELATRALFDTKDSYERRKNIPAAQLAKEYESSEPILYDTPYLIEKELPEIKSIYKELCQMYENDGKCTDRNIKRIETITVHLIERIKRIKDTSAKQELEPMQERLMIVYDEIVKFYTGPNDDSHQDEPIYPDEN